MTRPFTALPVARFSYADALSGRLPALQAAMAVEYGPIFRAVFVDGPGAGEYVNMVGPEANRFVLHTGREHFSHNQGWTPVIGEPLGRGLLNMDPPEHTRHRKFWNPAFTAAAIEAYLPLVQRIVTKGTAAWAQQEAVDVYHEAQQLTFAIAAQALAGFTPGPQVAELSDLFAGHAAGDRSEQLLRGLIAERRARPVAADERDVVGMIVRARDDDGQPLSDRQIVDHINILLVAGHETTTVLGAWVLYLLATLPEQRQRIEGELAELVGDASGPVTVEALRGASQLDHFIKEAGRLYAPVLNVPRGVVSGFAFGGYAVPAGAHVQLGLAAGHLLPEVFAAPLRFDPDRFAPPWEEDRRTPYALVTFGGGPRICIGLNFAMLEVKALAAHVLRHYRLAVVDERSRTNAGVLVARPDGPIQLRVSQSYPGRGDA